MSKTFSIKELFEGEGMGLRNFEIIQNAVHICKNENYCGILFPSGAFEIYNEKSLQLYNLLMNGRIAADDYSTWKNEKNVLIEITDFDCFTIEGSNTSLLFSGLIAPVDFNNCEHVTIRNISFDWEVPLFSTGKVISVEGNQIIINPNCNIPNNAPVVSFQNFDSNTGKSLGICIFSGISNATHLENGLISLVCNESNGIEAGMHLILRHIYSFAPVMHFMKCSDISVSNVEIKSGPGMGIIAHCCGNAVFDRLKVVPGKDRPMSSNCDATHFISCYGTVKFSDCCFEAMGDDAVNVHGLYLAVTEITSDYSVTATLDVITQDFQLDIPWEGDTVEFVKSDTLQPFSENLVSEFKYNSDNTIMIQFAKPIPSNVMPGDCIANITKTAQLEIERSSVKNIRGRAILIQTRGAKVHDCLFESCTGQGVHIDTASGWRESVATRDIDIRNNRFVDCGYGSTKYCDAVGVVIETECEVRSVGVHKNITISGNYINGTNTGISISCAEGVTITDNIFKNCINSLFVEYSKNVSIQGVNPEAVMIGEGCENESIKFE